VRELTTLPLWIVALILAAVAPWCVRVLQSVFERRLRQRTIATIAASRREQDAAGASGASQRQGTDGPLQA
jgi:hypothetical protein